MPPSVICLSIFFGNCVFYPSERERESLATMTLKIYNGISVGTLPSGVMSFGLVNSFQKYSFVNNGCSIYFHSLGFKAL